MKCLPSFLSIFALLLAAVSPAQASPVYVLDAGVQGNGWVVTAEHYLMNLGYTLTNGGPLADYSAYSQVWDLRYQTNLSPTEQATMAAYLRGGGRMYLTGENPSLDGSRNISLVGFLNAVGAGPVSLAGSVVINVQPITAEGQVVNSPHVFATLVYNDARTVTENSSGFLVTEFGGTGEGTLVGWDFGDIAGAASARMLTGFDIEVFQNGQDWVEDMATYLDRPAPAALPEPTSLVLCGMGALALAAYTWGRRN
jgi:hypothetical protein